MNKEYDLLVFVGRFQPFHNGHKRVVDAALEKSNHVLVLVGSSGKARTIRNPFTFEERSNMIFSAYENEYRIVTAPLYDKMYNDTAWVKQVQDSVQHYALTLLNGDGFANHGYNDLKIGLIGASKDNSSYYLKLFPQWDSVDVSIQHEIHATSMREKYLEGQYEPWLWQDSLMPKSTIKFLDDFLKTEEYEQLQKELAHIREYKKSWEAAPYPVKHVTVDAIVEQSGHILLVRRRSEPGLGLWALPGGHLNIDERLEDGMVRELREETKIKVPEPVLRGSIERVHTFDDPFRSTIGRVITQAYHIKLADQKELPKVKGSDDADKAKWVPINEIREDMMYDDHFHIIQFFTSTGV